MWRLMSTVDLLKHGIPDPSSVALSYPQGSTLGSEKEKTDKLLDAGKDYMASPVFVHTKLRDQDITPQILVQLKKALGQYFNSSTFMKFKGQITSKENYSSSSAICTQNDNDDARSAVLKLFLLPSKTRDKCPRLQYESCTSIMWKLRDQVLSMTCPSFSRTVSERDWLKNSAKIWEIIKNSSILMDYTKMLYGSGLFRR